jgi:hypothetical protein
MHTMMITKTSFSSQTFFKMAIEVTVGYLRITAPPSLLVKMTSNMLVIFNMLILTENTKKCYPLFCIFHSQKLTCLNTSAVLGTKKSRQIETKIIVQPVVRNFASGQTRVLEIFDLKV